MDLNEHLSKIVEGLIADITTNVLVKVDSANWANFGIID
jgi:hypothetical protein